MMNELPPTDALPTTPDSHTVLDEEVVTYINALIKSAPQSFTFRTGSGRMLRDLLLHWPVLDNYENEALALCQRITDDSFPLAYALHAQAVEFSVTFSQTPIDITPTAETRSTLLFFDVQNKQEYESFLEPNEPHPATPLFLAKGIAVVCRPLNVNYHLLKDDRARANKPGVGIFELAKRQLDALYEITDFIPQERGYLYLLSKNLQNKPENFFRTEMLHGSDSFWRPRAVREEDNDEPPKRMTTSLSGLPVNLRNFERQAMSYVMDAALSPRLRAGLRRVTQNLRANYPQALFTEMAQAETAFHPFKKEAPPPASPSFAPQETVLPKQTLSPPSSSFFKPTFPFKLSLQPTPMLNSSLSKQAVPVVTLSRKVTSTPVPGPVITPIPVMATRQSAAIKPSTPYKQEAPLPPLIHASASATIQPNVTQFSGKQDAAVHAPFHTPEPTTNRQMNHAPAAHSVHTPGTTTSHTAPEPTINRQMHHAPAPHTDNTSGAPTPHTAPAQTPFSQAKKKREIQPAYESKKEARTFPKTMPAPPKEEILHSLFESAEKQDFRPAFLHLHNKTSFLKAFPKATPVPNVGKLNKFILAKQPSRHSLSIRNATIKKLSHFILEMPAFGPSFFYPHF